MCSQHDKCSRLRERQESVLQQNAAGRQLKSGTNRHTETLISRSSQIFEAPLGMYITNTPLRPVSQGFAILWPSCVPAGKNVAIFAILPVELMFRANIGAKNNDLHHDTAGYVGPRVNP